MIDPNDIKDLLRSFDQGNIRDFLIELENVCNEEKMFKVDVIMRLMDDSGRGLCHYAMHHPSPIKQNLILTYLSYFKDEKKDLRRLFLDGPDKEGDTPLMIAAQYANLSTVQELVAQGASTKSVNHHGRTALHKAILGNKPENLAFLIEKGALTGDGTIDWEIPRNLAQVLGYVGCVEVLDALEAVLEPTGNFLTSLLGLWFHAR